MYKFMPCIVYLTKIIFFYFLLPNQKVLLLLLTAQKYKLNYSLSIKSVKIKILQIANLKLKIENLCNDEISTFLIIPKILHFRFCILKFELSKINYSLNTSTN